MTHHCLFLGEYDPEERRSKAKRKSRKTNKLKSKQNKKCVYKSARRR